MSKEEIIEVNKRVKIMELLKKGLTYKQISQKLGVGSATIARVTKKVEDRRHFDKHFDASANESVSKKSTKTKLNSYAFGVTDN